MSLMQQRVKVAHFYAPFGKSNTQKARAVQMSHFSLVFPSLPLLFQHFYSHALECVFSKFLIILSYFFFEYLQSVVGGVGVSVVVMCRALGTVAASAVVALCMYRGTLVVSLKIALHLLSITLLRDKWQIFFLFFSQNYLNFTYDI